MAYPYPFEDIDLKLYTSIADNIETIYRVQKLLGLSDSTNNVALEAVIVGLGFLSKACHLDFEHSTFADMMAHGCEGVLFASAFKFQNYLDVEINKDGYSKAIDNLSKIPQLKTSVEIRIGSIQDYFPFHAEVVYLDCTKLSDSMCDEGILVEMFFRLARRMLAGSYLLLVTIMDNLTPDDFGADHLQSLSRSRICIGSQKESMMWIYKKIGE